jgi:hypothetical protein
VEPQDAFVKERRLDLLLGLRDHAGTAGARSTAGRHLPRPLVPMPRKVASEEPDTDHAQHAFLPRAFQVLATIKGFRRHNHVGFRDTRSDFSDTHVLILHAQGDTARR